MSVFSVQAKVDGWKLVLPGQMLPLRSATMRDLLPISIPSRIPRILTESMLISCTQQHDGKDIGRLRTRLTDPSICCPLPNLMSDSLAVEMLSFNSFTYAWMLSRRLFCEATRAACSPASALSISLCLEHLKGLLAWTPILWDILNS
jgi:hypothetical protein